MDKEWPEDSEFFGAPEHTEQELGLAEFHERLFNDNPPLQFVEIPPVWSGTPSNQTPTKPHIEKIGALMQMKYIVVGAHDYRTGKEQYEFPIMFPHNVVHKDMADITTYAVGDGGDYRVNKVLGAGFCEPRVDKEGNAFIFCYGESESLEIKSRGQKDSDAFARCQNLTSTRV